MKKLFVFFLLSVISVSAFSQNRVVKGSVWGHYNDGTTERLIGAFVIQEGTSNGTITDATGMFTITVPSNANLVISYIGLKTKTESVKGKQFVNVILEEDDSVLCEPEDSIDNNENNNE